MAIPVDQATKNALQAAVKEVRATITWQDSSGATGTITSENEILSIKKESEGYYLASALRKITIVVAGTTLDLFNKQVTVTPQVKTGANSWGNIPWGSFTISEMNRDEDGGKTTFIGYGGISRLQNTEYNPDEMEFPTTVAGLAEQIADVNNIEIETDMTELPNYDAPIAEDLWAKISGTTYRDVLEEIAGATGTMAVISGGNDQLNFIAPPKDAPTDTMNEENLKSFKLGDKWGEANAVVLSRQPQGDNIELVDVESQEKAGGKNLCPSQSQGYFVNQAAKGAGKTNVDAGVIIELENNTDYTISTRAPQARYRIILTDEKPTSPIAIQGFDGENNDGRSTTTTKNSGSHRYLIVDATSVESIQVEKGSTATPYEPFVKQGRTDVVIANNEILDDQRETAIVPLLPAFDGWEYRNATLNTEGHGYHEVGDRIDVTIGSATHKTVITKTSVTIDGGIKETLTSTTPEKIAIDYAKVGGITKTIYNTSLAVDKQGQEIEAIVSRQDNTDAEVASQFTQVRQTLTDITATAQKSGGGNFLRNSVGYGKNQDGTLTVWEYGAGATTETVHSMSSTSSLNAGGVSGYEIEMTGATISQTVNVTPGEEYNMSLRAQKGVTGTAAVTITNGTDSFRIDYPDQEASTWRSRDITFTPSENTVTVSLIAGANTTVEFTDMMLAQGGRTAWRQASGEIYNAQVSIDTDGVQVRSSAYAGDYVEITPLEFAGYSNASGTMKKVFSLNRETTEVEKLKARAEIDMPPLKIVPINNSSYKGWAFVKEA